MYIRVYYRQRAGQFRETEVGRTFINGMSSVGLFSLVAFIIDGPRGNYVWKPCMDLSNPLVALGKYIWLSAALLLLGFRLDTATSCIHSPCSSLLFLPFSTPYLLVMQVWSMKFLIHTFPHWAAINTLKQLLDKLFRTLLISKLCTFELIPWHGCVWKE